jgi:hypothetical protein
MKKLLPCLALILCLTSLTGCGATTAQVVKTEYIKTAIPAPPPDPLYYPVVWQCKDGLYILDADNAGNLLKNKVLADAQRDEMKKILEGLRK